MKKFIPILTITASLLMLNISHASTICDQKNGEDRIAAFAVVKTSDGYVNVRQDNKIIGKLPNGEVVFIFEEVMDKPRWCNVDSPISGQIHDSGLKLTSSFTNIPRLGDDYSAEFANKDIRVSLKAAPFQPNKHKIVKNGWQVISIDGRKDIYGGDGDMPQFEYTAIEVKFADKTVKLPKYAYQNLFNGDSATSVNYDQKNDILYIHMSNGDGAGSYEALLVLKNKKFYKQYVGLGF